MTSLPSATVIVERLCFHRYLSVHRGADTPPGQTPLAGKHHPPPPKMATAADGTHPTGMHSGFKKISVMFKYRLSSEVLLPASHKRLSLGLFASLLWKRALVYRNKFSSKVKRTFS